MEKPDIKDYIEKRVQSSNQAHEEVIRDLQKSVKDLTVMVQMLTERMEPLIKWFETFNIGKGLLMDLGKGVAWFGGLVVAIGGSYYVIKSVLQNFVK